MAESQSLSDALDRLRRDAAAPGGHLPPPWDGDIVADDAFLDRTKPLIESDPALLLAISHEALRQAEARGDEPGAARALSRVASASMALGHPEAIAVHERAVERALLSGDLLLRSRAMVARTGTLTKVGRYADALEMGLQGLTACLALDRADLLNSLLLNLTGVLYELGDHEWALELVAEQRQLLRAAGGSADDFSALDNNEGLVWCAIGRLHRDAGDDAGARDALARARACVERSCEGTMASPSEDRLLTRVDSVVTVLVELPDVDAARAWVERVAQVLQGRIEGIPAFMARLDLCRIEVELAAGSGSGRDLLERLRRIERSSHYDLAAGDLRVRILRLLASACERVGDWEAASRYWREWSAQEAAARASRSIQRARVARNAIRAMRNEAMSYFAHDLRLPLTVAMQQLRATRDDPQAGPLLERLDAAETGVRRALDIADQALAILRAEHLDRSGLVEVDLGEIADDVCEVHAPLPSSGVRLHRDFVPGMQISGDRALLSRLIENLLSNALRHAPEGSAVGVKVERVDGDVVLSVRDEGPGLPLSMKLRLFQRHAADRESGGHGLGLALVARVARLHGARLKVDSGPGRGTTVSLSFRAR